MTVEHNLVCWGWGDAGDQKRLFQRIEVDQIMVE